MTTKSRTSSSTARRLLALAATSLSTCDAWMLPVSSPIMSLPIIEATPQHPSTALPVSVSMPPFAQEVESSVYTEEKKARAKKRAAAKKPFKVFCDLDGVLVDFEHGIRQLYPKDTKFLPQLADLEKSSMWKTVREADAFFENLPWTSEGRQLWQAIQHLQPDILTGVPIHPSSRAEKFRWCLRELGQQEERPIEHVDMACPWTHGHRPLKGSSSSSAEDVCRVITCWSSNKHYESGPGHVLIDDRLSLKDDWERKGGIFIHHQPGNLEGTLRQLEECGLLLHQQQEQQDEAAVRSRRRA